MAFCPRCGNELPAGAAFCPNCGAAVAQPGAGAASTAAPTQSAPVSGFETLTKDSQAQQYWGERLVAFIIDAVIVFFVAFVLVVAIAIPFLFLGAITPAAFFFGGFALLGGVIFVLYFAITESTSGASIGKRIFKLKVVSRRGSTPTFGEAFIRNLSKIYWLLLLLDVIVGLAISKGYQQKYSDSFMGTSVVRA
jgi:uncharacterized RDD family membrane protein YckC